VLLTRDQGKLDESIKIFQRALRIVPERVEVQCNLAMALLDSGKLAKAEQVCKRALSHQSSFEPIISQLSDALHFQHRISDWDDLLDTAIANAQLPADSRNKMWISKAIIAWVDNDIEHCKSSLMMARSILDGQIVNKETYSAQGYYKFLRALVQFREEHPELYAVPCINHVYIIGDSHSLSYANTVISLKNKKYCVIPRLIMGCKAWHFAKSGKNKYKASLDCAIQQLPVGATVIISVGEIDCRTNEGILPAHKKYGMELKSAIRRLVCDFVRCISDKTKKKDLTVFFLGVPAPNCSIDHLSAQDRQIFLHVIELFNVNLSKAAARSEQGFIDTYHQTVAQDGYSNNKYHIDAFHLDPDFLILQNG